VLLLIRTPSFLFSFLFLLRRNFISLKRHHVNKNGKAQAIWLHNTLLLPQRAKSNSDQGFALLSFGEEPCPLSLSHGFFTIQPSPSTGREKSACPFFSKAPLRMTSLTSKNHFTMIYNMFKIMTMNNLREFAKGKHHGSV
jgi:hypothetical protein